jgi:hypothetical protein
MTEQRQKVKTGWQYSYKGGKPLSRQRRLGERNSQPIKPLRTADVVPLLLPLVDLSRDQCRYPYNQDVGFLFCGHVRQAGSSYCPQHHALCYRPVEPLNAKHLGKLR